MSHGRQHRGIRSKQRSTAAGQADQLLDEASQESARREAAAARRLRRSSVEKIYGTGPGKVFAVQDAEDNITMIRIETEP